MFANALPTSDGDESESGFRLSFAWATMRRNCRSMSSEVKRRAQAIELAGDARGQALRRVEDALALQQLLGLSRHLG
jgi:hypothetical protein